MSTALDLVTAAFTELGVLGAGDVLSGDDADLGLNKLLRLFSNWNAERQGVYADDFTLYTLTANLNPHTIGPSGTFNTAQRPVTLDGANLVLSTTSPPTYQAIALRNRDWWLAQAVPAQTSTFPTDVYYDPAWPNGTLHFWPIPTVAYQVSLQTRIVLAAVTLVSTVSLPPGYEDAITLTLAEMLSSPMKVPVDPQIAKDAQRARARIFANNRVPVGISTRDAGMPGGGGGTFDYRTRAGG